MTVNVPEPSDEELLRLLGIDSGEPNGNLDWLAAELTDSPHPRTGPGAWPGPTDLERAVELALTLDRDQRPHADALRAIANYCLWDADILDLDTPASVQTAVHRLTIRRLSDEDINRMLSMHLVLQAKNSRDPKIRFEATRALIERQNGLRR